MALRNVARDSNTNTWLRKPALSFVLQKTQENDQDNYELSGFPPMFLRGNMPIFAFPLVWCWKWRSFMNFMVKKFSQISIRWRKAFSFSFLALILFIKFQRRQPSRFLLGGKKVKSEYMRLGPVRIRHTSHNIAIQPSHSVDRAGWDAKMASIQTEFWIL